MSDDDVRDVWELMGIHFVDCALVSRYLDAPISFVCDVKRVGIEILPGILVDSGMMAYKEATAMYGGEVMAYAAASLAFCCGDDFLTTDFCCN